MATPYNPTIYDLCRTALRRAGQPSPSDGMIGDAIHNAFQEVKNDIKLNCPTHPLLETNEMTVTSVGVPEYTQPSTVNVLKSLILYSGADDARGTVGGFNGSAPSVTSIFLEAKTSALGSSYLIGKRLFLLTSTGALQHSYIVSLSSSIAGISPVMAVEPGGSTTYLVADNREELYDSSRQQLQYDRTEWATKGLPKCGALDGETFYMNIPPDKIYPMIWTYYQDIDQMDEDSSTFTKMLREWRNIFVEGVTAKSMVLYDDNRQYEHIKIYQYMIDRLRSETISFTQTVPYDPIY